MRRILDLGDMRAQVVRQEAVFLAAEGDGGASRAAEPVPSNAFGRFDLAVTRWRDRRTSPPPRDDAPDRPAEEPVIAASTPSEISASMPGRPARRVRQPMR